MKKVVCSNVFWNVGTSKEHKNDQVFTQGFFVFSRGEYNESNESFGANEDDVVSFLNLKDMCQREASPKRRSSWHGKECNLQHPDNVIFARGCVTTFNLRGTILDDIFGDDHVSLTIFYCVRNILAVMTIWKWPLALTTMEDFY
jgi:hypothetical protein